MHGGTLYVKSVQQVRKNVRSLLCYNNKLYMHSFQSDLCEIRVG